MLPKLGQNPMWTFTGFKSSEGPRQALAGVDRPTTGDTAAGKALETLPGSITALPGDWGPSRRSAPRG